MRPTEVETNDANDLLFLANNKAADRIKDEEQTNAVRLIYMSANRNTNELRFLLFRNQKKKEDRERNKQPETH